MLTLRDRSPLYRRRSDGSGGCEIADAENPAIIDTLTTLSSQLGEGPLTPEDGSLTPSHCLTPTAY